MGSQVLAWKQEARIDCALEMPVKKVGFVLWLICWIGFVVFFFVGLVLFENKQVFGLVWFVLFL